MFHKVLLELSQNYVLVILVHPGVTLETLKVVVTACTLVKANSQNNENGQISTP